MNSIKSYSGLLPLPQMHSSPTKSESPQKVASPFKIIFENKAFRVTDKQLGEGGSGVVNRGFSKYTESPVAVKTVSDRALAQIEVSGLQFDCPHTVRFRGEFEQDDEYSIVMDEIVGKNVFETFLCPKESKAKLTLSEIKSIASQLFEILEDLEDKNLINYDIKPENLIWQRTAHALTLIDLASIREVCDSSDTPPHVTLEYLAPEWILGGEVDCCYTIWSTACTLFELIVGEKLFPKHLEQIEEYDFILLQIAQQIGKPPATYLQQFDRAFVCFDENGECKDKWSIPPQAPWADRLKSALVLKGASEEEIVQWTELLGSMLRYENRANPQDLLAHPLCSHEIKVHLVYDSMNKCIMQLRRASKPDSSADLTIDFTRDKNCCLHIPKDPNDQYIVTIKKGLKVTEATLTLKTGENLDIIDLQTAVEPAKKKLFTLLDE